jgi:hypothetical protein
MKRKYDSDVEEFAKRRKSDIFYPGSSYMIPYPKPPTNFIHREYIGFPGRFLCSKNRGFKGHNNAEFTAWVGDDEIAYSFPMYDEHLPKSCLVDVPDHNHMFLSIRTYSSYVSGRDFPRYHMTLYYIYYTTKTLDPYNTKHYTLKSVDNIDASGSIGKPYTCLFHWPSSSIYILTTDNEIWCIPLIDMRLRTPQRIERSWSGLYMFGEYVYGEDYEYPHMYIIAGSNVLAEPIKVNEFAGDWGEIPIQMDTYFGWCEHRDAWYRLIDLYLYNAWPVVRHKLADVSFQFVSATE